MKKVLVLMLALALCCALAACGGNNNNDNSGNNGLGNNISIGDNTNTGADIEIDAGSLLGGNTATGNNSAVEAYIAANRTALIQSFTSSFEASGMTCSADVRVSGSGFIMDVKINELTDVTAEQKAQMQTYYNQAQSSFDALLTTAQTEIPELTYFQFNICDAYGSLIATIKAGQ